jgi:spermidine synthase
VNKPNSSRLLSGPLLGLFFVSGISGLMYEVVWVRMLTRVLGSTSYATSTVLAVFMAGLGLGCLLAGRVADRMKNPLKCYAVLELAIGVSALISMMLPNQLLPLYRSIYLAADGSRAALTLGQVAIAMLLLLLPTTLMGATLPTLCAYGARRVKSFGHCVGTLYAVNTLGAFIGVLAAGIVLIGAIGETATILLGSFLNVAVSVVAFRMVSAARKKEGDSTTQIAPEPVAAEKTEAKSIKPLPIGLQRFVLFAFFVGGFVALANEVIWSRMLTLYQGTSIYAFSTMLGVVLAGIGYGSLVMGRSVDKVKDPFYQFARVQLLIGLAATFGLFCFDIFSEFSVASLLDYTNLHLLWLTPVVLLGPMTFLWGISFVLAVRCCHGGADTTGKSVSNLYTWNTIGSILGALAGGFWLVPTWGVSPSGIGLAVTSVLVGVLLLSVHPGGLKSYARPLDFGIMAASCLLLFLVGNPYYDVVEQRASARTAQKTDEKMVVFKHVEGASGTTTAFGPYHQLWVNGSGMTHLCTETKLMAHLPISICENPKDVLVICVGMGTTLRSASRHENLNIWSVELLPEVYDCMQYFHDDAKEVLANPRVHPVVDDGRNFLLMRDQEYDVITIDPAPPFYAAGTVNLYTREFFALAKSRLRKGGVLCLWIPPWVDTEVSIVLNTYLDVFEHVSLWTGPEFKGLYVVGSRHQQKNAETRIAQLFDNPRVVADLTEWDDLCDRPEKIVELYIADADQIRDRFASALIMTDDRPYTEFPLWRTMWQDNRNMLTGDQLRSQIELVRRKQNQRRLARSEASHQKPDAARSGNPLNSQ